MTWTVVVGRTAERTLRKASTKDRQRLITVLRDMAEDPYGGDIVALSGIHKGSFRRRVGSWRVLFDLDHRTKTVAVTDIRRRSTTTYR